MNAKVTLLLIVNAKPDIIWNRNYLKDRYIQPIYSIKNMLM